MQIWSRRSLLTGVFSAGYVLIAAGGATTTTTGALLALAGGGLLVLGVVLLLFLERSGLSPSAARTLGLVGVLGLVTVLVFVDRVWPLMMLPALLASSMLLAAIVFARHESVDRLRFVAVLLTLTPLALIPVATAGLVGRPDVLMAHQGAGDALRDGLNPYVVVSVEDTSPWVPDGSTIDGYPYPPAAMVPFAIVAMLGNAAWLTVLVLLAVTGWLAFALFRSPYRLAGISLAALHAAIPASVFMVFVGSTEPLSIAYFLASAATWRRRPFLSAVLFGFAIASKQYFAFMLVALLLSRVEGRLRYGAVAAAVAAATYLPFLLADSGALWEALVGGGLDRWVLRLDSLSVAAFGVFVPTAVILGAALVLLALLGRRASNIAELYMVGASAMALIAALSPQSFANYWYVVITFALIAVVLQWRTVVDGTGDDSASASVQSPAVESGLGRRSAEEAGS